jgi:hypothetical protein
MDDLIVSIEKPSLQEVFKEKGAKVADMGVVVYRRSTGVESHLVFGKGNKVFYHA